jgi:hypothetical protein
MSNPAILLSVCFFQDNNGYLQALEKTLSATNLTRISWVQGSKVVDYPFRNTYNVRAEPESSVSKFERQNPALKFESGKVVNIRYLLEFIGAISLFEVEIWSCSLSKRSNCSGSDWSSNCNLSTDTPILDETITIVKDKVWSFRSGTEHLHCPFWQQREA